MQFNPTGSTNASSDAGFDAPLETRFPAPGGLHAWLFSASGAERHVL